MLSRRHDIFYTDTIVFEVNNKLFRVPSRYFHEHSAIFGGASQLSAGCNEGKSDEHPVTLPLPPEASTDDFVHLLKVIWPLTVGQPSPTHLTREEWLSVLKLSVFWEFNNIRNTAITQIGECGLTLMDKIVLGRQFRVKAWFEDGLKTLASPVARLPELEELKALQLGEDTLLRLLYLRDRMPSSCAKFLEDFGSNPAEYDGLNCRSCGMVVRKHPRRKDCPSVLDIFGDELCGFE
ncbi:hypothetical protein AAF712_002265 [Marasmius tenuissimus]|uniref:BTB domain-containing protein n=1 Tax=Marasmius tenuissimus TaxID=585030 RepID=A0ABR3ABR0_9AGAR